MIFLLLFSRNAQFFDVVFSLSKLKKKGMCSIDDFQNVLGNITVKFQNNLNFVKNILKKTPPSEFHTHEI